MIRLHLSLALLSVIAAALLAGCGGGSHNDMSGSAALWNISISQTGSLAPAGVAQYSVIVSNAGTVSTNGSVSVTDSLPGLFTASSIFGPGWTCSAGSPISCTRTDSLAAGSSFPAITVIANISPEATGTVADSATISGGGAATQKASLQNAIAASPAGTIQHIVILFQENRTPDNLFQDPTLIQRGADIQNYGYISTGAKINLAPTTLATTYTLANTHSTFLGSCAWAGTGCEMNGADQVTCSGSGCPANAAYQYVQDAAVQPYYTMAETYAFGDRMFQTNQGPSFPAHQYIISGTSTVCVPGAVCPTLSNLAESSSTYFVSDNPSSNSRADGTFWAGCLAPPNSILNLIDTSQSFPNSNYSQLLGPECFEHPTLTDVLDANALSWKYYAPEAGSIWTSPNAIAHMCQPTGDPGDNTCGGPDWIGSNPKVVIEGSAAQVITDIQNGQLPAVTWVIPAGQNSDHSGDQDNGPSWVASIVNAIGTSPLWSSTAIIVTWDDWGGWYDHVPPPVRASSPFANSSDYGLRVPLVFISPYARPQHVSHQYNDFGSILRFIEATFELPQVNPKVGYADTYALGDLSDFYDLSQIPLTFTQIPSQKDAESFINSKEKATPPDND
jgi:phospholipase C